MKVDTCLEWEMQPRSSHRTFFHELLASTDTFNRKPIHSIWSNDAECLCCGDGGMLLLCDFCPASYHLECAGVEQVEVVFLSMLLCSCYPDTFFSGSSSPVDMPTPHLLQMFQNSSRVQQLSLQVTDYNFTQISFIICTRADARIAHFPFAKTANLTT